MGKNRIKKCEVINTIDDCYYLDCKVKTFGQHNYLYNPNEKLLKRYCSNKQVELQEEEIEKIKVFTSQYDQLIQQCQKYDKIILNKQANLYLQKQGYNNFKGMCEFINAEGKTLRKCFDVDSVKFLLKEVSGIFDIEMGISDKQLSLGSCDKVSILNNPIYQYALQQKDEIFQKQLLLYYRIASKEDCEFLEKEFGYRILPSLPEEYNHEYIVESSNIDFELLEHSGYLFLHRPYFAMQNYTRDNHRLNPYTKICFDASPIEQSISFQEYLKMFEENK